MAADNTVRADDRAATHLAPVERPVDPLFVPVSVEWIMDASIPIEIRMLCQMIAAKALDEARAEGRNYTDFGRDHVTTKINVDWIIRNTGWPKGRSEAVRAEAVEKGFLSVSGSSRTGYSYTVMMSLRTHRASPDGPAARSLFAGDYAPPKPQPSAQLELDEVATAAQPPPDMRKWSRADREFYSQAPGAIRTVFSRLSGANRKLFSRLSGANQALYSRTPGANSELLARLSGANDELSTRRSGVKNGLYNVRARSQELGENNYQNLLAEVLTAESRAQLLLLARKREEDTDEDSATFVQALKRIVTTLDELCEGDRPKIQATLERVIADERVTSHENPMAMMLRGVCNKPRFLLSTQYASKIGKDPDDRAFLLLPVPVQEILLDRIRRGELTPDWRKMRDINDAAARAAAKRVAAERVAEPPAVAPALPPPIAPAKPRVTAHAVEEPAPPERPLPAWWPALSNDFRKTLSEATFSAFFNALCPVDRGGERVIYVPLEFTLQQLRRHMDGRDLTDALRDFGYDDIRVELGLPPPAAL